MIKAFLSIFFSDVPDKSSLLKGLFVASCSDENAKTILDKLKKEYPSVSWTLLYRYDARKLFKNEEMILSSNAVSIQQKIEMLGKIRSRKDDIVSIAWTDEYSFGQLKLLGLLAGGKNILAITSGMEMMYLAHADRAKIISYLTKNFNKSNAGLLYFLKLFSWLFLFPVGILYILLRVIKLMAIRFWFTTIKKPPTDKQ